MDRNTYQRAQAVLAEVLDVPPERRAAVLAERCGDDPALRTEVEALLRHADEDGPFSERALEGRRALMDRALEEAERDTQNAGGDDGEPAWLPETIGDYRVVRWIGRGGAGIVLEAEQQRPRRRVALKVVHPAFATPETTRRLAKEAEALGRLQHPGIAQVYEAGAFDGGLGPQPFIAMELIDGLDLVRHAHAAGLDRRARVALVAEVADAVQHAHERGVVHRDLKPANVLVDRAGRPKLLDFGIARVLTEGGDAATFVTQDRQLLGTLAYMAPEQARGRGGEADPRVDVFALGALLFELVTGRRPRDLGGLPITTALREVAEAELPRTRDLDPSTPRDLETVIAKALEHRPDRRYDSAAAFAADLRRFLGHHPVLARRPSALDRTLKYVRRHRVLVGGAGATVLALSVGLGLAARAARDAAEAREASRAQLYAAEMVLGTSALDAPDEIRRVEALAAHWRPSRSLPDLRGWEWHLLERAARHDALRLAVEAYPMAADWSPDGRTIAVATEGGLALCDAATGARLGGADALVADVDDVLWTNVQFSPDGALVAVAGIGGVSVWDVAAGAQAWTVRLPEVYAVTWSLDGRELYTAEGPLIARDSRNGAVLRTLVEEVAGIGAIDTLPDGEGLAVVTSERQVAVVDRSSGEERAVWEGTTINASTLHCSPDGARIAVSGYDFVLGIIAVGARSLALERTVEYGQEPLLHVAWSPSGDRLAVAVDDCTVRLYDPSDGRRLEVFQGHRTQVRRVAWSPDGARIVSVATHGEALVWPVGARRATWQARLSTQHRGSARGKLSWSRDGGLLACSGDNGDGLVLSRTGEVVHTMPSSYAATLDPSGRSVALVLGGNRVLVHDLEQVETQASAFVGSDPWTVCAFDRSGRWLAVASRDGVFVAEPASAPPGGELGFRRIADTGHQVRAIEWSDDGRRLAYLTMVADVRVIDAHDGRSLLDMKLADRVGAYGVAWSPEGDSLVIGCSDGTLRVLAPATGETRMRFEGHASLVEGVAWRPGGDRIASASRDRTVKVWDTRSGALVASFDCGSRLSAVSWSPDGSQLVALDVEGVVHFWDAGEGLAPSR